MVKRLLFGLLWFVVLYLLACCITGGIAGGITGSQDPANATFGAGAKAGAEAVSALRGYLLAGSVLLSALGTWAGILPGTGVKKTAKRSGSLSIVLVIVFSVLAVIMLPGSFIRSYQLGAGFAYMKILESKDMPVDRMPQAEHAHYKAQCLTEGYKCALLMTLGMTLPCYLLILITVGLLTRSISRGFRVFLRFAFLVVWIMGMFFLSLSFRYYGQSLTFPKSLGPAFLIYLVVVTFFGIILGIGKLVQRGSRKQVDESQKLSGIQR